MLRIKALIGNTTLPTPTYYLSTEPLDYDGKFWEPRITNGFEITNHFSYSDKTGNRIRSITLKIDNRDGYFNAVQESDGFVNSTFTLYYDDASDKSMTFTGKVNVVSEFGDDIVLTLMEMGYEYLKTPFPDAQIAENYYTPEGLTNATWSTIPICIGTVNDLPVKWCDVFNNRFMVCSGPVFKVRKIKFDNTVMYDSTWSDPYKGYQPTPTSKKIKVRIYKGIGSDNSPETVDGIESVYKGFCYIEFYDADTGDPIEPRMSDNSVPQVYVDLDGLQNSANTDAERNPAQLIYNFFSKPTSGYEGYGLGVETSDLDFSSAITECDTQEFKIDGVINQKDIFGNWLDILLKSCRGAIVEESNKIKLKIDVAKTVSNIIFDESGETGYDCIVYPWSEPKLEAQINRLRLFYRLNPKTNRYDRIPEINQESPLGDTHLVDDAHALRVNKYNTNDIKFTLIRDDITAHKLAQYYFKRTILQLKTVNIVSSVDVPDNLTAGNVIKLTSAKYGWVEKEFTITQISKGEDNFKLQLQEYDSDVYVYNSITPGSDNTPVNTSLYSIPDKPTNMTLTIGTEKLKDGTAQTVITSTFTKPINNVLQTALYYKLKTDTEFKFLDSSLDNEIKHIWKGFQAGDYNFRLVSISPTGVYSSLDIESGDSHFYSTDSYSTETYLTITGDTTAPGIPIINNINPVIGGASISLGITGGTPSDFSHFKIWRCINGGSFTQIEDNWSTMLFTDIDRTTIGYNTVKYRFQAVDNSGNVSSCIDSGSITPLHVDTTDVANNAITTDKITTNQIIAKDFRTACNVGNGTVSGVLFNSNGIQAWNASTQTLNIDASTGNVTMSGTVTATAGNIGGFTIDQTEGLFAGTGSTRVQMKAGAGFWAGDTAQSSAPFSVNQAGVLTAKSGQIGGWGIDSTKLYNNKVSIDSAGGLCGNYTAGSAGWKIDCDGSAEFNDVTVRGTVCSSAGHIGGWDISPYSIMKTFDTNNMVGIGHWSNITSYNNGLFWGNNCNSSWSLITIGKCLYHGSHCGGWCANDGMTVALNDNEYFAVGKPSAGGTPFARIAGWNFNSKCLYSNNIIIDSNGSIGTADFVSGNKGWNVDRYGNSEFNNITARGAIKTAVFIKDEISVVGGKTLIRPASTTFTDTSLSSSPIFFRVDDNTQFAIGDIVRVKDGSINYWGTICACGADATGNYFYTTYNNGTSSGTITKGQAVVNYGSNAGCGGIILDGQTPYIDIYTHSGTPWTSTCSRVRLGNLNGSHGFVTDTYGIGIGSGNNGMTYDTASGNLVVCGDIYANNGIFSGTVCASAGYIGEFDISDGGLVSCNPTCGRLRFCYDVNKWIEYGPSGINLSSVGFCSQYIAGNFTISTPTSGACLYGSATNLYSTNTSSGQEFWLNTGHLYDAPNLCLCVNPAYSYKAIDTNGDICSRIMCATCFKGITSDTPQILIQNSSYGACLLIGGWAGSSSTSGQVRVSNGNLHLDSATGYTTYINYYSPDNICMGGGGCLSLSGHFVGSSMYVSSYVQTPRLGIYNTSSSSGYGLSLYNGYTTGAPTYGIMFAGTGTFGTHGGVTSDWATYLTMSDTTNRGWIFRRGSTNVASIDGNGLLTNCITYSTTCVYSPIICATNCIRSNIVCTLGYINSHCYQDYGGYGCCISMNAYRMNGYRGFGYSAIEVCVPNSNYHVALYTNGKIYGYLYNFSDRNLKCDIDYNYSILNRIRKAPIGAWKWKNAGGAECHVGMIAQDFHNYFSEFSDSCTTVPIMDGIALKAVKEVDENVQVLEQCNQKLEKCINDLSSVIKIQGIQLQKIQEQLGV